MIERQNEAIAYPNNEGKRGTRNSGHVDQLVTFDKELNEKASGSL